jgi:hypothetical protein
MVDGLADSRIPLHFGALSEMRDGDAVLIEGSGIVPAGVPAARFRSETVGLHGLGCPCCAPREGAAIALHRLYLEQARSPRPLFSRVLAVTTSEQGRAAVLAAVRQDRVVASWFRLEG